MPNQSKIPLILGLLVVAASAGCETERTLTVQSDPDGALVFLNGQEIGRTPVRTDFKYYGTYDVEIRKEGYEAIKTKAKVWAPWWQWPPIDLVSVFTPGPHLDPHELRYTLHEPSEAAVDPKLLVARAEHMEFELESGKGTKLKADRPEKKPSRVTTRPTTQRSE